MANDAIASSREDQFVWRRAFELGLRLRAVTDADLPFLGRLYVSTRIDELAPAPWTDTQKATFLDSQFRAQHAHYQKHYPTGQWSMIVRGGSDIGRLYIDRWANEHRLIDIALLLEYRRQGFGTAVLEDLIEEAAVAGKPLTIHVEKNNPAIALYRRLGFRPIAEHGVYDLLEVRAAETSP